MPRPLKRALQVAFDFVVLVAAVWIAFGLRLGFDHQPNSVQWFLMILAPVLAIPVFIRLGLYRAILRYLPDHALWTIVKAMTLATLFWVAAVFLGEWYGGKGVPRSIPVLYWFVGIALVGGVRFAIRAFLQLPSDKQGRRAVLIYGAGRSGSQLAKALHADHEAQLVGFIDDNVRLHGQNVAGIRVYSPSEIGPLIAQKGVQDIILSMPSASRNRRLQIGASLSKLRVNLRSMPSISELAAGKYSVSGLKTIELEDLLGRSRVPANDEYLASVIGDKAILVSGAGGSIGSELCRKIAQHGPRTLHLLDVSEAALYEISRGLQRDFAHLSIQRHLLSVIDRDALDRVFAQNKVDAVFHAGAYKHVPLLEENVLPAIANNVLGTRNLAQAAFEAGVPRFVLISTDKAVRPASVMGASKRWGELIVRSYADRADQLGSNQFFLIVRFGNVLGSNGSVVPLFREQIANGGPLTITDDRMTRYFMAIPEAAELILQSAALSQGGEIFLLDMGEPILIRTLAKNMIRLAGLTVKSPDNPDGDIEIVTVGMRPGEKLHEELFYDPSLSEGTGHPKIFCAKRRNQFRTPVEEALAKLTELVQKGDEKGARALLFDYIAEAEPTEPQKNPTGSAAPPPRH